MTTRDFFTTIANSNLSDEVKDFAKKGLEALDKRNAKRRDTQTKAQKENEGVKTAILDYLLSNKGGAVASEIAAACGISTQKASALLRQIVADGKAYSTEVKVKGKGKVLSYTAAVFADDDDETEEEEG